jgi:hypothetical protein
LGAEHGKIDADLRTFALLLDTVSVLSVHYYYPFALHDGGRLAHMAVDLVDRLAILVAVHRFPSMGVVDPRSLRSHSCVRMQHLVRQSVYVPFQRILGMCGVITFDVFLILLMALWVLIFATLYKRALLMLWHAFMFLGRRLVDFPPPFSFC